MTLAFARLVYSTATPIEALAQFGRFQTQERPVPVEHDVWTVEALQGAVGATRAWTANLVQAQVTNWLRTEFMRRHLGIVPPGLEDDEVHAAVLRTELDGTASARDLALLDKIPARAARHLWRQFLKLASAELVKQDLDAMCSEHSRGAGNARLHHFATLSKRGERAAQPSTTSSPVRLTAQSDSTCPRCALRRSIRSGSVYA